MIRKILSCINKLLRRPADDAGSGQRLGGFEDSGKFTYFRSPDDIQGRTGRRAGLCDSA